MIALLVFVPVVAFASYEEPIPIEDQPCVFTAEIDRNIRQWSERIQVFGYVHPNCETYELKDSTHVKIQIVDDKGNLVEDYWIPKAHERVRDEDKPKLYEVSAIIQTNGVRLQEDSMSNRNHKIFPGMYYVLMPSLNEVHFEPYTWYNVTATYGNMTISNNSFIIVD